VTYRRQPEVSMLTVSGIDYMTLGVFLSSTDFMSEILVLVNMLCLSALNSPLYIPLCVAGAGTQPTTFLLCQLAPC
jgi:hypothetical protein